jgi:hypothetical protein
MRQMGCVEPSNTGCAERQHFAIGQLFWRTIGHVADRGQRRNFAPKRHRAGRQRKPLIQRATLVGLEMRQGNVAEILDTQDAGNRLPHQRKHPSRPGVKQRRRLIHDEILVESETARDRVYGCADR